MKTKTILVAILAVCSVALAGVLAYQKFIEPRYIQTKLVNDVSYVANEILVKFKKDVPEQRINEINDILKTQVIKVSDLDKYKLYRLRILANETVPALIEKYKLLPEVEYAVPNINVQY